MTRQVTRTVETTTKVTLEREEYESIIRGAVGAPREGVVDIDPYTETITVTWSHVDHGDGA